MKSTFTEPNEGNEVRGRGRPRSDQARAAVLEATYRLLCTGPFDSLTIESIAKESKVGKPTIYKWWPSKASLALDAFLVHSRRAVPIPDTGVVATDLIQYLTSLSKRLCETQDGEILSGLFNEARQDQEFGQMFLEWFLDVRRGHLREMLRLGQIRGEIKPGIDLEVALNVIYGPIWYWLLIHREPLDPLKINALVDLILGGLGISGDGK